MEIIKPDVNIPFVKSMKAAGILSAVLVLAALAAIALQGGLIYGIDFAGGTVVEIKFSEAVDIGRVREALKESDQAFRRGGHRSHLDGALDRGSPGYRGAGPGGPRPLLRG